jgi:putative methyltransferase (TIGR04325 family)
MRRSDFVPPVLTRLGLRLLGRSTLTGDYPSWEAALASAAPYQTDLGTYGRIAEDTRAGLRSSHRLLSPLLSAMLLAGGRGRIVDFGGNLGFVYFDVRKLCPNAIDWWHVVDLPIVVEYGTRHFADEKLGFFDTIEAATQRGVPNLLLCFHVLQYLESPFAEIAKLLSLAPELVVLHEFPIAPRERFMVQHLLPELGGGSRPIRIFSEADVANAFDSYNLIEEIALPAWDRTLVDARHVARVYRRRVASTLTKP